MIFETKFNTPNFFSVFLFYEMTQNRVTFQHWHLIGSCSIREFELHPVTFNRKHRYINWCMLLFGTLILAFYF